MSAPLTVTTTLPAEKKPTYWFLQTIDDHSAGYSRMRLLPGQWIPVDESVSEYVSGNVGWNIKCNKPIRNDFPVGTTFVAEGIEIYKNCYNVPGSSIFPLVSNGKGHQVASADMREHFNFFNQGKTKPVNNFPVFCEADKKAPAGNLLSIIQKDAKHLSPSAESGFYVDPDIWHLLTRNVLKKINSLLIGPTGTGKTKLVQLLSERLGLDLSIFDLGAMHDPIAGLLGVHRLEKGVSVFDYSRFSEVIGKPGIILLDEISRPAASCNNILFPVLDTRRELPVEIAGSAGARNIAVHPECVFIGTANVGHEYTGTTKIDRGLLDRFFPMEIAYMTKEQEAKVLIHREGISAGQAGTIAHIAEITRHKAESGELSTAVSHRHTLMIASMVKDGFPLLKALEMGILPLYAGNKGEGERAEVKAILASK